METLDLLKGKETFSTLNKHEFDYQWECLPDPALKYNKTRIDKLLFNSGLPKKFFKDKKCLDIGCGTGRYTYALQELGATVDSFDISEKAVEKCRHVNQKAYQFDLMNLEENPIYDFVICWGVLHHLKEPYEGFKKIVSQVKPKGTLFIMVYAQGTQEIYEERRAVWRGLTHEERVATVKNHGTWDALNPRYNHSFTPEEVEQWYLENSFEEIVCVRRINVNIRGIKKDVV